MSFTNISMISVYYKSEARKILVGRLALKDRKIFFEYNAEFLKTGIELSPFKLPLQPGVITCEDRVFDGLFGVFNDSLPDGWGRLLLDRKLMKMGIHPGMLSPLDRLCYVGNHGMGALAYEPGNDRDKLPDYEDLDEIAAQTLQFQKTDDSRFVDDLFIMNGSSAGARPKILVSLVDDKAANDWIVKFRSSMDSKDSGPIEYAYHLMAEAAKLDVPEARLFPSKKGPGYFGVRRFDRVEGKHLHMHTISGLLHADHRVPSLDYEAIMKATLWLTRDVRECEKQFRAAAFNVVSHNRDDHAKNFSYIMDEKGVWHVSPAYDLTFSSGPSGEHSTTIMGEGKHPNSSHLLRLAEVGEIKMQKAAEIIEDVKYAVSNWKRFAKNAGVSKISSSRIQASLTLSVKM